MASENDENMKKIMTQLQNEKELNQNLNLKYSELEKDQKLKHIKNEELEIQLKKNQS